MAVIISLNSRLSIAFCEKYLKLILFKSFLSKVSSLLKEMRNQIYQFLGKLLFKTKLKILHNAL